MRSGPLKFLVGKIGLNQVPLSIKTRLSLGTDDLFRSLAFLETIPLSFQCFNTVNFVHRPSLSPVTVLDRLHSQL